ncbi:iron-containing alcohol dehydrogenase [Iodobacter sp. HSC-16F04]|uniref:Iron-containing alcohol dehydrogenase n=1 Tax=Iodobacter violaceini TaxID=3044271 RepID=A0ABX0KNX7_9NEIS|nr:alcohol dehydrogenase-like regulatory protein ErcA [Iodobacter violacea]NHQ86195.1 iron-containing alcohol dehydrogenase [Iodobacter violacea]
MAGVFASLRKFVSPEFVFGMGSRKLAGSYAQNLGARHVLLVSDPGVIAAGWAGEVEQSLLESGLHITHFSALTPNPKAAEVMHGAAVYIENRCDVIVCVGGGSVIDCAKGIGIVVANRRHILEFEGIDQIALPPPPLICIPTTSGTSADVSQFAIITNAEERVKIAIISKAAVPDVSLIDPETVVTMDLYLTACTGIDALVHAVEAFVSQAHGPVSDLHALEAIRLIHGNLLGVLSDPADMAKRSNMMLGSMHAGLAFSNASLGAVHAMAHSMGGFLDLAHGECNAMLLDHVIEYNYPQASNRFLKVSDVMGLDLRGMVEKNRKQALLDEVRRFKAAAGILHTLSEKQVRLSDLGELARKAFADPCIVTNPRQPVVRDLEVIYEQAL